MDSHALRTQLTPQWSGVNIAITVVLFLIFWPFAAAMIAYIIWGRQLSLDLSRPHTFVVAGRRLGRALSSGMAEFSNSSANADDSNRPVPGTPHTGRPQPSDTRGAAGEPAPGSASNAAQSDHFEQWRQQETERLRQEREALDFERRAFEKEREAHRSTVNDASS